MDLIVITIIQRTRTGLISNKDVNNKEIVPCSPVHMLALTGLIALALRKWNVPKIVSPGVSLVCFINQTPTGAGNRKFTPKSP